MKKQQSSKCCVYWIHLPEHIDVFSQGYIGRKISGEALENIRKANKCKQVSDACRAASIKHVKSRQPWENPKANKELWCLAGSIYIFVGDNPTYGLRLVAKHFNFKDDAVKALFKKIKSGWNPLKDPEWLIFSESLHQSVTLEISH